MQEVIFREVWLTEDRRIKAIPVAENSKIPIMLKVMDVTISGSAHAYAYSEKTGVFLMNRDESPVENNTVTIIPDAGLFQPGDNKLQVHFFAANGKAITGEYNVVCVPDFSASGEIPEASEVIGLVERAERGAANAEQSARAAAQSETAAQNSREAAETAKSEAESAKRDAETALSGAQTSEQNAAASAENAENERKRTEQLRISITEAALIEALGYKPASPDEIPNVPNWAMQPNKPSYTPEEVKARPDTWVPDAADMLEAFYPVGSIYLSTSNVSPADIWGGTWERIKDRFLLAAGDRFDAGAIGGEVEHTLSIDEMPSHTHGMAWAADWGAASAIPSTTVRDRFANIYTDETGGDKPHNNMPPYLAVNVWTRTA